MGSAQGAGVARETVGSDAGGALGGEVYAVDARRLADTARLILADQVLSNRIAGVAAARAESERRITLDALA